jgi:hypothetical protein
MRASLELTRINRRRAAGYGLRLIGAAGICLLSAITSGPACAQVSTPDSASPAIVHADTLRRSGWHCWVDQRPIAGGDSAVSCRHVNANGVSKTKAVTLDRGGRLLLNYLSIRTADSAAYRRLSDSTLAAERVRFGRPDLCSSEGAPGRAFPQWRWRFNGGTLLVGGYGGELFFRDSTRYEVFELEWLRGEHSCADWIAIDTYY